ncbi:MAG: dienelactone hydrolase family protein [Rhodospirillaceae bacterium]|jgi:carboxymethylenebutenolidase|nr:dienelactone hydrolase family protein [Rhodospirillaceae bacterium]MBT5244486.1 dienelactone hydrolase family protein [Rhodospirillaceae bacterium]MBT5560743.1 dienelactone hydrolase family protein [Rhodospirillaceae bacterium]MBT6242427.1 dienelactone hydrolase family protein [Rhodospirillaceae bacterium]MBT7136690.1 dienelactone hydrolase family protein [Rhodospirillaceae bacterium]
MARLTAGNFDQELLDIYDRYAHGLIERREFLNRAAKFAVGGISAAGLLKILSPDYALANQVEENDKRIQANTIEYASPDGHGAIKGYLVRPAGGGKRGGVVVVHENRGLNPYIADVARRLAVAGFTALAPDGLTPLGGYPGTDDEGKAMQKQLDKGKLEEDFVAAFEHLKADTQSNGKVGVVGFCYGGGVCNSMAVRLPGLAASVPFYGRQPAAGDVSWIKAPLLLHYAELDTRINKGWPAYEAALKAEGKEYTAHIYPGVNHGFHNDTTPRYDKTQAELAWSRTVAFFKEKLA